MHNTNATADLSTCNGTPATFGQHNDSQDREDTERTRPVTPPSVPPPPDLRPPFVPLEHAYAAYGDRLHTSATMSFFSGVHCAEQFIMASKARLFGDDNRALSATLASDDPREQKRLGRHVRHFDHDFWQQECENSALRGNLAKFSHEKMRPALVHTVPTPPRRSEPPSQIVGHRSERVRPREDKRLDSHVRHFGYDLLQKDCEHIAPRGNIATFSQKDEIRLALGRIGERRLAEACHMINCGVPA